MLGKVKKKVVLGERYARAVEMAAEQQCPGVDSDDSVSLSDVESGTDVQTTLTLVGLSSVEAKLE